MKILAVDPGIGIGVALAVDSAITHTEYHEVKNILQAYNNAKECLIRLDPDLLVVECQYVGNMHQLGTVIGVVEKRCAWEIAAYELQIEFARMYPSVWQKLISGGKRRKRPELAKLRTSWIKENLPEHKYPNLYINGSLADDQESALAMLAFVLTLESVEIIEECY